MPFYKRHFGRRVPKGEAVKDNGSKIYIHYINIYITGTMERQVLQQGRWRVFAAASDVADVVDEGVGHIQVLCSSGLAKGRVRMRSSRLRSPVLYRPCCAGLRRPSRSFSQAVGRKRTGPTKCRRGRG